MGLSPGFSGQEVAGCLSFVGSFKYKPCHKPGTATKVTPSTTATTLWQLEDAARRAGMSKAIMKVKKEIGDVADLRIRA